MTSRLLSLSFLSLEYTAEPFLFFFREVCHAPYRLDETRTEPGWET